MKRTQQHQPGLSRQASSVTASAQPPGVTISRMDTLRRRGQPEQAVALLRESLAADPAAAVGLLALLRAAARLDDARLLLALARDGGPALCIRVAHALGEAGAADDAKYLFNALEHVDLGTVISVMASLDRGSAARAQRMPGARAPGFGRERRAPETPQSTSPLLDVVLRRPAQELVTTLAQLREEQRPDEAGVLVEALCQGSAEKIVAVARGLASSGLTSDAYLVIDSHALRAGPCEVASVFASLARFWPDAAVVSAMAIGDRQDAVTVMLLLEDVDRRRSGARPAAELIRLLPVKSIARLCHAVCGAETYDRLDAILAQCAERADRDELCMALYELDLHSAAYHLARSAPFR